MKSPIRQKLLQSLSGQGFPLAVVDVFARVDRQKFIPPDLHKHAWADRALPIGADQTISQPFTIAFMLTALDAQPKQKILEVGAGSGYVLALLATLLGPDTTIIGTERVALLADKARERLKGYKKIAVVHTPAGLGLPEQAPFDRILVSAAATGQVPPALLEQLNDPGILVCPVDEAIVVVTKKDGQIDRRYHYGFVFVPLIYQ